MVPTLAGQSRAILFAVASLVGASMSAIAQANDAWFGLTLPPGLGDPHRAVVDVKRANPPALKLPADETRSRELRGERIVKDVAAIVEFSKQSRADGNKVWGRVTGFPSAKATLDWTAKQLRDAGLSNVQVQEYAAQENTSMWWAKEWDVKLIGDEKFGSNSRDVVLETAVPTSGSMMAGGSLTGELIHVGAVADENLPEVDVRGKIAVQTLRPVNGAYSERRATVARAQELSKRGAVAVFNIVQQTGNMHVRDFGNCGAPCFNLGTADGAFVLSAIERAAKINSSVRARLRLQAEQLTGLKGHNVIGIIPGQSDENIIVNAHADGWYDAAGDNADGLAVLVALARHFAGAKEKPARTLVFVASGGHHSAGLNGPANVVRMNPELVAKTVLVLNLEHIAQLRIRSGAWNVDPTEQPMNFGIDNSSPAIIAIGKRGVERYGFNLNPEFGTSVAGDLGGYAPLGVARVQAIHSGPMYHTSGDVLETISVAGLERAAHFYAYFIREVATTPRDALNPKK